MSLPTNPETRTEEYLNAIATDGTKPTNPETRLERYLDYIADNVGGEVEANPTGEATDTLNKIKINNDIYSVGGGSETTKYLHRISLYANRGNANTYKFSLGIYILNDSPTPLTIDNYYYYIEQHKFFGMQGSYVLADNRRELIDDFIITTSTDYVMLHSTILSQNIVSNGGYVSPFLGSVSSILIYSNGDIKVSSSTITPTFIDNVSIW